MNPPSPPNELQEVYLHEAELEKLTDTSLPAAVAIAAGNEDAEEHLAPRFIP
ncbi:MAG TPA: hypothetical protein VK249_01960 [Anaerolineales bacterium]|nr:hypothetical protein [Anaerolineales bacterium]